MKYRTKCQNDIVLMLMVFFIALCAFWGTLLERNEIGIVPVILAALFCLFCASMFVHCITYNVKRKYYMTHGKCIPAEIVAADCVYSRPGNAFYFTISFNDEGTKILYTDGYMGNPYYMLKDWECNVYKLNGKYIEADFHVLDEEEKSQKTMIPIIVKRFIPPGKIGKVTEK